MESISLFFDRISSFTASLPPDIVYMLRVLVAAACGAAIGVERSKRQKEAGIRTHIVVAIGAALMMIVSKYAFFDVARADASRIASNVITGVSFLGAGVIFVKDSSIKGLTTAAGIWATSGIGLAIGAGMTGMGVFTTLLIIILQVFLHKYASGLEGAFNTFIKVKLRGDHEKALERLIHCLDEHEIEIINQRVNRGNDGTIKVQLSVKVPRDVRTETLSVLFDDDDDIISIEI